MSQVKVNKNLSLILEYFKFLISGMFYRNFEMSLEIIIFLE